MRSGDVTNFGRFFKSNFSLFENKIQAQFKFTFVNKGYFEHNYGQTVLKLYFMLFIPPRFHNGFMKWF